MSRVSGAGGSTAIRYAGPLVRQRLLQTAALSPDRVVVVAAPSGFGKSVLIRQLVQDGNYDRVVSVDLPAEPFSNRLAVRELLEGLDSESDRDSQAAPWALQQMADPDDGLRLAKYWVSLAETKVALVLDGVVLDEPLGVVPDAIRDFLRFGSEESRLFIATRSSPLDFGALGSILLLNAQDLRLEFSEAAELHKRLAASAGDSDRKTAELVELTGGHIASFLVMCRLGVQNRDPLGKVMRAPSLDAHLRLAAGEGLDAEGKRTLFACALLGRGDGHDLAYVLGESPRLSEVAQSVPLVSAPENPAGGFSFLCHDIAARSFCTIAWAQDSVPGFEEVVGRAIEVLLERRDHERLIRTATELAPQRLPGLLRVCGQDMLDGALRAALSRALGSLPTGALVSNPDLLVLDAKLHWSRGDVAEAERRARVACELARHGGDQGTEVEALTVVEAVLYGRGDLAGSQHCLKSILDVGGSAVSPAAEMLVRSGLALVAAQAGDWTTAEAQKEMLGPLVAQADDSAPARARAELRLALISMGIAGDLEDGMARIARLLERPELPICLRLEANCDLAASLVFTGRLERATVLIDESNEMLGKYDIDVSATAVPGAEATLFAGQGHLVEALAALDRMIVDSSEYGDLLNANYGRLYRATILGATGDSARALRDSEHALEYFAAHQVTVFKWQAIVELGCALLANGDRRSSRVQLAGVRSDIGDGGYLLHLLKADLALAEIDRTEGLRTEGTQRLTLQRSYILSENANWQTAMTLRTFPGVLGMLAEAVAPAHLPLHMLRMVGNEKLDEGVAIAREWMEPQALQALLDVVTPARPPSQQAEPVDEFPCRVRLFGGLEVTTVDGTVGERDWKKRKARLLFAMLASRRGQDVPRDQLLEHLWPEMDEDRARNNFYVIFNAMKHALTAGNGTGKPCPYVVSLAGVCSVDSTFVRSDLDDFYAALAEGKAAEASGDGDAALEAYGRLADIYRGDLLPGDIYDDWFSAMRDTCRSEFSDSMLRAAALLAARDDVKGALHLVRRALAHDRWREDLYRTAIEYQISAGQRSAAVETYMTCKSRLSEDLGLDPSDDTKRLYGDILAMESDADWL